MPFTSKKDTLKYASFARLAKTSAWVVELFNVSLVTRDDIDSPKSPFILSTWGFTSLAELAADFKLFKADIN